MNEVRDLVSKLRGMQIPFGFEPIVKEAADVIEALDKRLAALEDSIKKATTNDG